MKIEIRKYCKQCGNKITKKRFRTYCSIPCRNKWNYKVFGKKYIKEHRNELILKAQEKWQRKLEKEGKERVQCLICGKWYVQVGSHVFQFHKMTARDYREMFNLEVKRGTVPTWYRKLKGDQALENKTYKNLLKAGKKFRFKKGANVGRYKRSPITLERLKNLYKFNK